MKTELNTTDKILSEMVLRLVEGLHPRRIYLFGSRARGDNESDSDYDFLVVVDESDEPKYLRSQRTHELLSGVNASKDAIVLTHREFEKRMEVPASLPGIVLREGILLYEA